MESVDDEVLALIFRAVPARTDYGVRKCACGGGGF